MAEKVAGKLPEVSPFDFAVEAYARQCPRNVRGERILTDEARQIVADALHVLSPGWWRRFSLDDVGREVLHMPPVRRVA